jgi:hypothetical protein
MNAVVRIGLLSLAVWGWNGTLLSAQPAEGEERTVDFMLGQKGFIDNYINTQVQSLKEQYSLTPEQVNKVRGFITKDDVRILFKSAGQVEKFDRDMRKRVEGKKELTIQDLQDIQEGSKKLYPLCQKTFKSMMIQAVKIHSILTDEQKKSHQKEIDEVEMNTAELTTRLGRWKEGNIKAEELKECFTAKEQNESENGNPDDDSDLKMYSAASYDYWELYVKTFIEAFGLDKGQQAMAYSVLSDMKSKAEIYRKDHAAQYEEAQKRIDELRGYKITDKVGGKNAMEALAEKRKQLQDIDKPLLDMFEELKQRLMKIPTEQQRKCALEQIEKPDGREKARK